MANAGYKAVIQLGPTTFTTITNVQSAELQTTVGIYDITSLVGSQWMVNLAGLASYTLKITGFYDLTDAEQVILQGYQITTPGGTATWQLMPTGGSNPGFHGTALVKDMDLKVDIGAAQSITWNLVGTGALTYS